MISNESKSVKRKQSEGYLERLLARNLDAGAKLPILNIIEMNSYGFNKKPALINDSELVFKDFVRPADLGSSRNCWSLTPRGQGLILLNLVMLACASTFVVLKEGQQETDPFVFSTVRFVIAALAFFPFWTKALQDWKLLKAGMEIGVWAAGGYLAQSVSMITTDAARGAFLSAFTVVVVPILAGIFGNSKIKRMTWVAVVTALLGVMLLEDSGSPPTLGDFWSFASAVLFGIQIFRTEHWSKVYGSKSVFPMMSVALGVIALLSVLGMCLCNPALLPTLLVHPQAWREIMQIEKLPWLEILYTSLIVTDAGLWAEIVALQHVTSTEAAIIYTLEPVFGAAFAYVLLGERWGGLGWIGASMIVVSCFVTQIYGTE